MIKRKDQASGGSTRLRPSGSLCRGIAIAAVVAMVGLGVLIGLRRPAPDASRYTVTEESSAPTPAPIDPLRAELTRCRALPANADDARCREAWEVNRRRFLGESRSLILLSPTPDASSGEPLPASLSGNGEH